MRKDAKKYFTKLTDRPVKEQEKSLYTVIPQTKGDSTGAFMSSTHTYQIPTGKSVEISLKDDELDGMDEEALKKKFAEGAGAQSKRKVDVVTNDLSDMVDEHQEKKKRNAGGGSRNRDFKF